MQATIRIKASELDYNFFKKLKSLFKDKTFVIDVEDNNQSELDEIIEDAEINKNFIQFSGNEYLELVKKIGKSQ